MEIHPVAVTHPPAQDRRRFTRITFDARTELRINGERWPVQLVDISLKGLLVRLIDPVELAVGDELEARVTLARGEIELCLPVTLTRMTPPYLGFECGAIDLESISHLRRLLELNLGDASLLDRELEQLVAEE
nr:PilZ domain-containing protein [Motiliproteus sp. SC1-56]